MTRENKPADPTAERTADQSTQANSGLTGGKPAPAEPPPRNAGDEDLMARKRAAQQRAPRRYEVDEDPALPADDATLKTKI